MNHPLLLVRRYAECAAFVLLWMAVEHTFRLSPAAGQMMGIPLTAAFQLAVARRPLQQLWAFDAEKFRLDGKTLFSGLAPFYIGVLMMGVLLSFCARRARTLVPSSIMHAFGNAYMLALIK